MIIYQAMYRFVDAEGQVHGRVLDFPGAITCGSNLDETRSLLASALADMAETYMLLGKPLPKPEPTKSDPESDIEEPIYLLVTGTNQGAIVPESAKA
jgi:predicted RNase H-like HicB family nuclease